MLHENTSLSSETLETDSEEISREVPHAGFSLYAINSQVVILLYYDILTKPMHMQRH